MMTPHTRRLAERDPRVARNLRILELQRLRRRRLQEAELDRRWREAYGAGCSYHLTATWKRSS